MPMFRPNKYTDINRSTLWITARIIEMLCTYGPLTTADVAARLSALVGDIPLLRTTQSYMFLYAIGVVEYIPSADLLRMHEVRSED